MELEHQVELTISIDNKYRQSYIARRQEVGTPIESNPVTVLASAEPMTFAQKADERRKAVKAAAEAKLAAMESEHAANKAELEREDAEMLRPLNDDLAAEEEALRFEVDFE